MKLVATIPMCGGHDKAFHVQIERKSNIIDPFYFCTDEGISTHRTQKHMMDCLEGDGFAGFLDIKSKAIPIAQRMCRLEGLPEHDMKYLVKKLELWTKLIKRTKDEPARVYG